MLKRKILLLLMMVSALQAFPQLLEPTKTEALIYLVVGNSAGKPLQQQEVTIESETTKKAFKGYTNLAGAVEILAPCGDSYLLHFPNAPNYARFLIPKEKYYTFRYKITFDGKPVLPDRSVVVKGDTTFFYGDSVQNVRATYSIVLLHFRLTNYTGEPLDSEIVSLRAMKSAKTYIGITGKNGEVFMLLPKGDQYTLDFAYEKNIDRLDYPMEAGFRTADVSYMYEGSRAARVRLADEKQQQEKAQAEQLAFNKEQFKLWSDKIDEYTRQKQKADSLGSQGRPPSDSDTTKSKPISGHAADPVVSDVLARNFYWNTQLFVTDLTGSMSPYTQQLAGWFRVKVKTTPDLTLVFFNDGDGKPDKEKVIGNTGGLHNCEKCNEQALQKVVQETIAKGNGGDAPENNTEALIKSIEKYNPSQPVVMIADNKAPVKDIELLDQVKVPLRIILCGVKGPINPDYIKMAYATKGSLHTLKEDIYKLPEVSEGRIVTIGGYRYAYSRGRFVLLK